jgi:hypothetical protein
MTEEPDKADKKKSIFILILDKLVIVAIIVVLTYILEDRNATKLVLLASELQHSSDTNLISIKSKYDISLAEIASDLKKNSDSNFFNMRTKNQYIIDSINFRNELLKQNLDIEGQIKLLSQKLTDEIKANKQKELDKEGLNFLTSQLQEFYWPILIRLEKNNAIYKKLDDSFVGKEIDEKVVLPNHLEIVDIIENKIHLAQADTILIDEISYYVGHVYTYKALRKSGYQGYPKQYHMNDYREEFYKLIKARTNHIQERYNNLIDSTSASIKELYGKFIDKMDSPPKFRSNLDLAKKTFTIKLAYNKNRFFKFVGEKSDSVVIVFSDYSTRGGFCTFKLKNHKDKAKMIGDDIIDIKLEEGEIVKKKLNKKNYKIILNKTWKEGARRKASLTVESWEFVKK